MDSLDKLSQQDQSTLQSLLNNSGGSLIPESLVTTITITFVMLNVIAVALTVVYVISLIRKWKVQSAILRMQKDVAEIKQSLTVQKVQTTVLSANEVKDEPVANQAS